MQVTINGTDFQSFELADDDIQGEVVDKSSSSTSTAERSLAASPEMGIIGFMTEQRKLYSKDAADPTGGVPGNRGKDMYTTGSHTREQPSEATDYGWRAKEPSGVQDPVHSTCPAVGSVEKHPVKPAVRHMNLKEAMQHVSQVEIALKSILGPLERITGHLKGEGLLCCPITQVRQHSSHALKAVCLVQICSLFAVGDRRGLLNSGSIYSVCLGTLDVAYRLNNLCQDMFTHR